MSDETSMQEPMVKVGAQYVKDLSFENPNAPASLAAGKAVPKVDVAVNISATPMKNSGLKEGELLYEVSLQLQAKADGEEGARFLIELTYAGLFTLSNVAESEREPALLIYCPTILFPFVRRVVADTSRDGGFPPLLLDPIDFTRLYQARQQHAAA